MTTLTIDNNYDNMTEGGEKMERVNQYGINDAEAWREHVRKQRKESTRRYREVHQVKQVMVPKEVYEYLKIKDDGKGVTISERLNYMMKAAQEKEA